MQIDRARFLLLTASLAGTACSANPATSGNVAPTPEPATTGSELTVAETTSDVSETTSDVAETTSNAGETTSSTTTPQPQPQPATTGVCDNDTATVPACSISAPPGPYCESFADTKATCKGVKKVLRGAIAEKAVTCLNAASGTQGICDFSKVESCLSTAIRAACVQPSTFSACAPVIAQCAGSSWSKITMTDCQALLSSVKDGKRAEMITCMSEGCSIESCTWMLR